jgi:hypothetical protein
MIDPIKAARRDFEAAEVYFRLTPTEATRKTYEAARQALAFAEAAAELPASNAAVDDEEDQDERPFPDSDEAIRALQDVAESVDELLDEIDRLRNEIKTAISERDEARQLACEFFVMDGSGYSSSYRAKEDALARGWDCFNKGKQNNE